MKSTLIKKIALILGLALVLFLYYYLYWGSLKAFTHAIDSCDRIFCDFSRYYYAMGKHIFIRPVPTEGFYYSPLAALLFSLWRFQSYESGIVIWGIIQILSVILLTAVWLHSVQSQNFPLRLLYFFLILTAMPIIHNFKWGQVSIISNLAIFSALELYESNKKIASSFWLAFGTIFKFYPVILLLYFVLTGDFTFVFLFISFLLLLGMGIPTLFIGFKPTISFYFSIIHSAGTRFSFTLGRLPGVNSLYFPLVLERYFGEFNNISWVRPLQIISFLILGMNVLLVVWVAASTLEHRFRWVFLIMLASTPFYVSSSWVHYFTYVPAFQIFLAFIIKRDKNMYWKYFTLFLSIVLSSVFLMQLFKTWGDYAYWGFLVWSNMLLLLLTYIELIPQLSLQEGANYYKNYFHSLIRKGNPL